MAAFPATRIEGGLLAPDVLDQLLAAELPGQKAADFGLEARRNLTDEIAAAFADARALWGVFQNRLARLPEDDPATTATRDLWMIPFFELLGYELKFNPRAYDVDGATFAISHRAGAAEDAPPVHIVGARQELGRVSASGRPRLSPHALVQEYLNRTEHLWGLVANGLTLRLLRDSTFVRRQAYVEFDLAAIFDEQRFQDFAVLYRLLHRTRLPRGLADAEGTLVEQYYQYSLEQGGRVREKLRDGVEACIVQLANGFLRASPALREAVTAAAGRKPGLSAEDLYRELLRLVYRLLFLLVSEDRGLVSANPVYREHYGIARLRRLLDVRAAYTADDDLWQGLRVLWKVLTDERLAQFLEVAPLNGELFAQQFLDRCTIANRDLLEAFWNLAYYRESPAQPWRRVNYAALDVEELGSVYESLLELHPHVEGDSVRLRFELVHEGRERRATGSHYTPPELVAPLIQHALEPVLAERLKGAASAEQRETAILGIKVCDPACGSGHFLLAAARRLGKELARIRTGEEEPAPERVREAVRDVIAHCIYGVDKNPLAVDLCRVALWLEGHASGKPLTFLDHRIRCGDSLLGLARLDALAAGIPDAAFKAHAGSDRQAATNARRRNAAERATSLFQGSFERTLAALAEHFRQAEAVTEDSIDAVRQKAQAIERAERSPEYEKLRLGCDTLVAAFFQNFPSPAGPLTTSALHEALARGAIADARLGGFVMQAQVERRFLHWPLAFPEVIAGGGFDVILGNPPFMGGLRISGNYGEGYRAWLEYAFAPFAGTADLCAAFFRRAYEVLQPGGRLALIATNTLGQGDTRESGLAPLLAQGAAIAFAQRFVKWPGAANVEVNLVAIERPRQGRAGARHWALLDGRPVPFISSRLDDQPEREPQRLPRNEGKAFIGDFVRGIGFVLDEEEAEALLAREPRNADCLFPYLNGEDLNSQPQQQPSRWVICFHGWDLRRARDYPDLLRIVEERVKPERERLRGPGDSRNREYWWQFGAYRAGMRQAIAPLSRLLVRSRVSEMHMLAFVPQGWIYNEQTVVFAFDDDYHFALLQSAVHETWVWRNASSLESRNRYTPTDCFDTFPFPAAEYAASNLKALVAQPAFARAATLGAEYYKHRRQVMQARGHGLTKTYNLFHDRACADADIARLRELHAAMDAAILACYGWEDLELGHGFHANERGQTRFMPAETARRELLARLLDLNQRLAP